MQPSQQREQAQPEYRNSMGDAYLFAQIHSTCITPFIRADFGTEALGLNGFLAFVLLLFTIGIAPEFQIYFFLWLFAVICQRIRTARRERSGQIGHSRYNGWPWLAMKFPRVKSEKTAKLLEPFLCLASGAFISMFSPPVGAFVMAGFVSLSTVLGIELMTIRAQLRRFADSEIEQRLFVERRSGRRDF
jgi:hypothetical protein